MPYGWVKHTIICICVPNFVNRVLELKFNNLLVAA